MCNLSDLVWEDGVEQGIEQGIEQGERTIILAMLRSGMSVEEIVRITGKETEWVNGLTEQITTGKASAAVGGIA